MAPFRDTDELNIYVPGNMCCAVFIGLPPNDNLTLNSLHKRLTISDKPKRDLHEKV